MSKNKKNEKNIEQAVQAAHKRANIAVAIVVGIAMLVIIAIAVMSAVRVDPLDGVTAPDRNKSEYYELYDRGGTEPLVSTSAAQSKIRTALDGMDFSVMNAVLQWHWDYSYNFVRNSSDKKIEYTSSDIKEIKPSADEYMVELVYQNATVDGKLDTAKAQSLTVDGEKIYFDRLKLVIADTDNSVGEIKLYPYVYERVTNTAANDGLDYLTYRITPVKVRANTTQTYKKLASIVTELNNG